MRNLISAALLAVLWVPFALAPVVACTTTREVHVAPAPPPPSLDPFYEPLALYGDWWWNDRYGWVYSPFVSPGWRPYTVGTWVWTDDHGWFWVSSEPFGWATFHYGRWLWLDDAGWVWVPGRVWGPAWVAWRIGPGFIGWGPLPPGGLAVIDVAYGPWGWVFLEERLFLSPDVAIVALPAARNPTVLPSTRVLHRPERARDDGGDDALARALDRQTVERAVGAPVAARRVTDDARQAPPGTIVVPRARSIEVERRPDVPDLPGPRGVLTPGRDVDERPLAAPSDAEIEERFEVQKEQLREIHENERRAPPPAAAPDVLRQRQDRELRDVDENKAREQSALKKKRTEPKKVPKATAKKKRSAPRD